MLNLSELTLEQLAADPKKFGLPTFEEFRKNPSAYKFDEEARLGTVDAGSVILRNIKRHIYYVNGYKCDSLEKAQDVAKNMGFVLGSVNPEPDMQRSTDGRYEIHVHFKHPIIQDELPKDT
ncbi:MAG: hypothetical protein BWZ03_00668 [bacterium ADurb.BinA186]|nr:MAG: hypothetical protein BWZ03_00668 [bacterium ADurb.BinA186]